MTTAENQALILPDTLIARAVLDTLTGAAAPAIANHSIRTFLFARLFAAHQGARPGADYDESLLFAACALHDIGLTHLAEGDQRFELDGADYAAAFLTERGVPAADADQVWEAIALNTTAGVAERRGTLCRLARAAVVADFGRGSEFITDVLAQAIHDAYPRLNIATVLVDTVVDQARSRPHKAPAYTMAAEFVHERSAPTHVTGLEKAAQSSRWSTYT